MSQLMDAVLNYERGREARQEFHAAIEKGRVMTKANGSGLVPLGCAVLVEPYEPERKNSNIILPPGVADRTSALEQRVTVVAVGPACWPGEPARAKPGDRVLVSKFSGYAAVGTADGKPYRFINDRDVFARIEVEAGHG